MRCPKAVPFEVRLFLPITKLMIDSPPRSSLGRPGSLPGCHRIIQYGLKRTTVLIEFQPPATCRVANQQPRLPRATSSLALNACRDGASTASLGNLFSASPPSGGKPPPCPPAQHKDTDPWPSVPAPVLPPEPLPWAGGKLSPRNTRMGCIWAHCNGLLEQPQPFQPCWEQSIPTAQHPLSAAAQPAALCPPIAPRQPHALPAPHQIVPHHPLCSPR